MIGLPKSSSSTPVARSRARAPAMLRPWVLVRERSAGMSVPSRRWAGAAARPGPGPRRDRQYRPSRPGCWDARLDRRAPVRRVCGCPWGSTVVAVGCNLYAVVGALTAFGRCRWTCTCWPSRQMAATSGSPLVACELRCRPSLVGLGLGQALHGPVSDRYGRRRPLLVGLAIFVVASLGCALARACRSWSRCGWSRRWADAPASSWPAPWSATSTAAPRWPGCCRLTFLVFGLAPVLAPTVGAGAPGRRRGHGCSSFSPPSCGCRRRRRRPARDPARLPPHRARPRWSRTHLRRHRRAPVLPRRGGRRGPGLGRPVAVHLLRARGPDGRLRVDEAQSPCCSGSWRWVSVVMSQVDAAPA